MARFKDSLRSSSFITLMLTLILFLASAFGWAAAPESDASAPVVTQTALNAGQQANGTQNNGALSGCAKNDPDCARSQAFSQSRTLLLAAVLSVLYWVATVIVRWNRIAHPTREMLKAQILSLESELDLLKEVDGPTKIKKLLDNAKNLIGIDPSRSTITFADVIFWSRGRELTGWGYVHEAEVQMAAFLPDATVVARLESAVGKLRVANDAPGIALADRIDKALNDSMTSPERCKALLAEALSTNYDREDISFADLLSWQNKAAWLVALGLLLILVLAGVDPKHSVLLLIGAVGGLLSRLSRSLDRKDVPTDYGASWSTLFLSPVAGSLAAWAGVLVSGLATEFNVLGPTFKGLWSTIPPNDCALAAALLFGFSERLFDTVLDKLAAKTGGGQNSATPPASSPGGGGGSQPPRRVEQAGQPGGAVQPLGADAKEAQRLPGTGQPPVANTQKDKEELPNGQSPKDDSKTGSQTTGNG